MDIRQLREKGLYYTQIGEELGIDPRTAARYCSDVPPAESKPEPPGILENYKEFIVARMAEGVSNAVVMLRKLRERGYRGSISTVRAFMAPLRAQHRNYPVMRYETGPGEQMQVDWGEFGKVAHDGQVRRLHCFVATLGYSRYMYAEFTVSESLVTLVDCHKHAFEYLGGYTKNILYDNMPTIVKISSSGEKIINPKFNDLAVMMGFTPRFCRIRRPETKGKVESGVKYVRYNFWQGVRFRDLDHLNEQMKRWLMLEANARIHGTTHRMPMEMLCEEDLIPLIDTVPFIVASDPRRKVGKDCLVSYDSSKYSVPWQYANREVAVIDSGAEVRIFCSGELAAEHRKAQEKHSVMMNPEHYRGIPRARRQDILGGKQIIIMDGFDEVQQRSLRDYDDSEGGEF